MARKPTEVLAAWTDAQIAVCDFWFGSFQLSAPAQRLAAWSQMKETVGGALGTSAKAALALQVDLARACAERVAASSRSSKFVVEAAHQAYDLVLAYAEAGAATCDASLAASRCADAATRRMWNPPSDSDGR